MDFFLWGHIKALIYISPVDSEDNLFACVVKVAATFRQKPGIFEPIHQSLLCYQLCIEVGGHTFEHLL
jgi:hypothetical protein